MKMAMIEMRKMTMMSLRRCMGILSFHIIIIPS